MKYSVIVWSLCLFLSLFSLVSRAGYLGFVSGYPIIVEVKDPDKEVNYKVCFAYLRLDGYLVPTLGTATPEADGSCPPLEKWTEEDQIKNNRMKTMVQSDGIPLENQTASANGRVWKSKNHPNAFFHFVNDGSSPGTWSNFCHYTVVTTDGKVPEKEQLLFCPKKRIEQKPKYAFYCQELEECMKNRFVTSEPVSTSHTLGKIKIKNFTPQLGLTHR